MFENFSNQNNLNYTLNKKIGFFKCRCGTKSGFPGDTFSYQQIGRQSGDNALKCEDRRSTLWTSENPQHLL